MPLNIGDANAINLLLDGLLGQRPDGTCDIDEEAITRAAVHLAQRASDRLGTGWTPARVRRVLGEGPDVRGVRDVPLPGG